LPPTGVSNGATARRGASSDFERVNALSQYAGYVYVGEKM
jgi:hypothetical protein